jgi:peptidoglycan/xylan/chitin deacetylase (PgdA/CDA1 family)
MTSLRSVVKSAAAQAIALTAIDRLAVAARHRAFPFVAAYHRVVEHFGALEGVALPAMEISARTFEKHLDWMASRFEIISLDDFGSATKRSKPLAAITFDDGYSDIYHHAFPILKRKGIPAGIFIVTDLVGTAEPPMHERLHALLATALRRQDAGGPAGWKPALPVPPKIARDPFAITRFLLATLSRYELLNLIAQLELVTDLDEQWRVPLRPLDWNMLREMQRAGMTIGSHTRSHPVLTREIYDDVREEAEGSRRAIERHLGTQARCFAYPNGSFNRTVVDTIRDAGYDFAFTICRHRDERDPQLTVPRKMFWERSCLDASGDFSPAIMSCHAATMFDAFSRCSDH